MTILFPSLTQLKDRTGNAEIASLCFLSETLGHTSAYVFVGSLPNHNLDILSACIFALHVYSGDQSSALQLDAMVCRSPSHSVLGWNSVLWIDALSQTPPNCVLDWMHGATPDCYLLNEEARACQFAE
jgi:hypothetical protein